MKILKYILLVTILSSCAPGFLLNKSKSDSYFLAPYGMILYSRMGNWFEIGLDRCRADLFTFKVLSPSIAKDKNYVYCECNKQRHVDRNSFYIDKGIPKDKDYAYEIIYDSLNSIKGVDAASFEYLGNDTINFTWSRDKDNYYLNKVRLVVDYNSFRFLNRKFSYDRESLYAELGSSKLITVRPVPKEITIISKEYIRDEKNLYYVSTRQKTELKTLPFASFIKIRKIDEDVICVNDKVIYYGRFFGVEGVDADSFVLLSPGYISSFAKDKNNVFYKEEIIKEADPKSFEMVYAGFSKDKKHVYYQNQILVGADPKSFRQHEKYSYKWIDDNGNTYNTSGEKL